MSKEGLRAAGVVGCGRPVTGGVRSENFIGERDLAVNHAELEFCVGEDEAFARGVLRGFIVDLERECAQSLCLSGSYRLLDGLVGDVFVVAAGVDLGGGSEDGFRQAVGFTKARGEFDAADGAGLLVVLPPEPEI